MQIKDNFWKNKKVLITGHTGFKGSWLCLWLNSLGADITGYALEPPTDPSLYKLCKINELVNSVISDIRDLSVLQSAIQSSEPEIIIHMAAQPLVRESYLNPTETYMTNVMGTVNLLNSIRNCNSVRVIINVTTDKCYDNKEWFWGYRENEPLGGYDPYSSSKACSEIVTSAFRNSFFNIKNYDTHRVAVASARAGNVIGGGDWADDRLIPDCIRSILDNKEIHIRNPNATRPWQHVLDPLSGYMTLAEKLYNYGPEYSEAWNFGPNDDDARSVEWVVKNLCSKWGNKASYVIDNGTHPHEANYLKLDISKAKSRLSWAPTWDINTAIEKTIEWSKAYFKNEDLRECCLKQINEFTV